RAAVLYGKMRSDTLNVVAGANKVSYNWSYDAATGEVRGVTPQSGNGSAPALAVDVAVLGGMYANAIQMIATEKGVGVRVDGSLISSNTISLDASGQLKISNQSESVKAKKTVEIRAQGPILLEGSVISENSDVVRIQGDDDATISGQ